MKNLPAIIRLFAANTISGCAQGISMLAIPWYFADILQDAALFGQIYTGVTVISLFWGLYAGVLVDQFNRKNIFIAETFLGGILLLGVVAYTWNMPQVPIPLVAMIFASTFFGYNIHYPALYAFAQEITEQKDYTRITSYLEIQGQITNMAAGAVGALLLSGIEGGFVGVGRFGITLPTIEPWRLQEVFLLDGCTYLLSFLIILPMKYESIAERYREKMNIPARFKIGLDFLKNNPYVFIFGATAHFLFATVMVINFVLMPSFTSNDLGGEALVYTIGESCFALGAAFAGLLITQTLKRFTNVGVIIGLFVIATTVYLMMMFNRNIAIFYLLMLALGWCNAGVRIMRITYLFRTVENQIIGRVGSVFQSLNVMMRATLIYVAAAPFFLAQIHFAFLLMGVISFAAVVILGIFYGKIVALDGKHLGR
ncbi:MAG: MFS transporter [Chitinophagales bacterium]